MSMILTDNNNVIMKALGAQLDHQAKGLRIPEGTHHLDHLVTVRVTGTVQQAPDQEYTPTTSIPLLAVLARVVQMTGWAGDRAIANITRAAAEALRDGEPVGEYIEFTNAALQQVRQSMRDLPPAVRTGQFRRTVALTVQGVERVQEERAAA